MTLEHLREALAERLGFHRFSVTEISEGSFAICIVDEEYTEVPPMKRQVITWVALRSVLDDDIYSLIGSIETFTPEEFDGKEGSAGADCS